MLPLDDGLRQLYNSPSMAEIPHTAPVSGVSVGARREGGFFFLAFVGCVLVFAALSLYLSPHVIDGDAVGYLQAVRVYQGEAPQPQILPGQNEVTLDVVTVHRMLTTPLGIQAVRLFSDFFGSDIVGWLAWDTILFFAVNILFYFLLLRVFRSPRVAFVGGLFFAGNYSMVVHGLALFMDIGGWFFYILSIYCLFAYIESGKYRDLFFSALAIAIGALFKENALVAAIPLAAIVLYEDWRSPVRLLSRSVPLGLLVVIPLVIHHVSIYFQYGYTYLVWVKFTEDAYHYSSRLLEYVKSLGSLLTFLAPVTILGAFAFVRPSPDSPLDMKRRIFIGAVLFSSLPAALWLAVTQRVLFMVVPGCVLLACVFIKRHERYWYAFLPVIALYVLSGFFMDSFILKAVNLPF